MHGIIGEGNIFFTLWGLCSELWAKFWLKNRTWRNFSQGSIEATVFWFFLKWGLKKWLCNGVHKKGGTGVKRARGFSIRWTAMCRSNRRVLFCFTRNLRHWSLVFTKVLVHIGLSPIFWLWAHIFGLLQTCEQNFLGYPMCQQDCGKRLWLSGKPLSVQNQIWSPVLTARSDLPIPRPLWRWVPTGICEREGSGRFGIAYLFISRFRNICEVLLTLNPGIKDMTNKLFKKECLLVKKRNERQKWRWGGPFHPVGWFPVGRGWGLRRDFLYNLKYAILRPIFKSFLRKNLNEQTN